MKNDIKKMGKGDSGNHENSFELFDNLLEGCQVLGLDWRYIYLNKTADIHNRCPGSELLGKLYTEMWPGIEKTYIYQVIKCCIEERKPEKIENEFTFPDGTVRWFLLSIQPLPQGVLILSEDVTEGKTAERNLRESEKRFKSVFEASNVAKSITTLSGEINVNKAFCNMLGYTEAELHNKIWQELTPEAEIEPISRQLEMLTRGEMNSTRFEKRYIRKDGSQVRTDVSVALHRDSEGKALYFLATILDLTERSRAEEEIRKLNEELESRVAHRTSQLEEANREMETFIYSVSHDLKAPLRGIDGYSKLLVESYGDKLDDEAKFFISSIRLSTLKMNQLIEDLLEYSHLDRSLVAKDKIRIRDLILSVASNFDDLIRADKLKIIIEADGYEIQADQEGLKIALRNLIDNAVKFSSCRHHPEVEISVSENLRSWTVKVRDNGIGFDMKYNQKIFVIFQRLHRAEDYPGNGIGLAMVSKAMQKMKGKAWAESIQGVGSSFFLEIPKN
jgi:PAS domain S-box-containing protein